MVREELLEFIGAGGSSEILCLMQDEQESEFDAFIDANTQVVNLDKHFCHAGYSARELRENGISFIVCYSVNQLATTLDSLNRLLSQLFRQGIDVFIINYGYSLGTQELNYSQFLNFQEQLKSVLQNERVQAQRQLNFKARLKRELESEEFLAVLKRYEEGQITQKRAAELLDMGLTTFRGRLADYWNSVEE